MAAPKTPDLTACPYWGKGGRYVIDPATGNRVPAGQPAPVEPVATEVGDSSTTKKTAKKGE